MKSKHQPVVLRDGGSKSRLPLPHLLVPLGQRARGPQLLRQQLLPILEVKPKAHLLSKAILQMKMTKILELNRVNEKEVHPLRAPIPPPAIILLGDPKELLEIQKSHRKQSLQRSQQEGVQEESNFREYINNSFYKLICYISQAFLFLLGRAFFSFRCCLRARA